MARLVYGLGSENITLHMHEVVLRALQNAILTQFQKGTSFFLRGGGTSDDGSTGHLVVWLTPSAPLAFRYDSLTVPKVDEELAAAFIAAVDAVGGINLPGPEGASDEEVDSPAAEEV